MLRASGGGPTFANTNVATEPVAAIAASMTNVLPVFVAALPDLTNHIPPNTNARLRNNPLTIVWVREMSPVIAATVSSPLSRRVEFCPELFDLRFGYYQFCFLSVAVEFDLHSRGDGGDWFFDAIWRLVRPGDVGKGRGRRNKSKSREVNYPFHFRISFWFGFSVNYISKRQIVNEQ